MGSDFSCFGRRDGCALLLTNTPEAVPASEVVLLASRADASAALSVRQWLCTNQCQRPAVDLVLLCGVPPSFSHRPLREFVGPLFHGSGGVPRCRFPARLVLPAGTAPLSEDNLALLLRTCVDELAGTVHACCLEEVRIDCCPPLTADGGARLLHRLLLRNDIQAPLQVGMEDGRDVPRVLPALDRVSLSSSVTTAAALLGAADRAGVSGSVHVTAAGPPQHTLHTTFRSGSTDANAEHTAARIDNTGSSMRRSISWRQEAQAPPQMHPDGRREEDPPARSASNLSLVSHHSHGLPVYGAAFDDASQLYRERSADPSCVLACLSEHCEELVPVPAAAEERAPSASFVHGDCQALRHVGDTMTDTAARDINIAAAVTRITRVAFFCSELAARAALTWHAQLCTSDVACSGAADWRWLLDAHNASAVHEAVGSLAEAVSTCRHASVEQAQHELQEWLGVLFSLVEFCERLGSEGPPQAVAALMAQLNDLDLDAASLGPVVAVLQGAGDGALVSHALQATGLRPQCAPTGAGPMSCEAAEMAAAVVAFFVQSIADTVASQQVEPVWGGVMGALSELLAHVLHHHRHNPAGAKSRLLLEEVNHPEDAQGELAYVVEDLSDPATEGPLEDSHDPEATVAAVATPPSLVAECRTPVMPSSTVPSALSLPAYMRPLGARDAAIVSPDNQAQPQSTRPATAAPHAPSRRSASPPPPPTLRTRSPSAAEERAPHARMEDSQCIILPRETNTPAFVPIPALALQACPPGASSVDTSATGTPRSRIGSPRMNASAAARLERTRERMARERQRAQPVVNARFANVSPKVSTWRALDTSGEATAVVRKDEGPNQRHVPKRCASSPNKRKPSPAQAPARRAKSPAAEARADSIASIRSAHRSIQQEMKENSYFYFAKQTPVPTPHTPQAPPEPERRARVTGPLPPPAHHSAAAHGSMGLVTSSRSSSTTTSKTDVTTAHLEAQLAELTAQHRALSTMSHRGSASLPHSRTSSPSPPPVVPHVHEPAADPQPRGLAPKPTAPPPQDQPVSADAHRSVVALLFPASTSTVELTTATTPNKRTPATGNSAVRQPLAHVVSNTTFEWIEKSAREAAAARKHTQTF